MRSMSKSADISLLTVKMAISISLESHGIKQLFFSSADFLSISYGIDYCCTNDCLYNGIFSGHIFYSWGIETIGNTIRQFLVAGI